MGKTHVLLSFSKISSLGPLLPFQYTRCFLHFPSVSHLLSRSFFHLDYSLWHSLYCEVFTGHLLLSNFLYPKKINNWLHNSWNFQLKPNVQASEGVNGFPMPGGCCPSIDQTASSAEFKGEITGPAFDLLSHTLSSLFKWFLTICSML